MTLNVAKLPPDSRLTLETVLHEVLELTTVAEGYVEAHGTPRSLNEPRKAYVERVAVGEPVDLQFGNGVYRTGDVSAWTISIRTVDGSRLQWSSND